MTQGDKLIDDNEWSFLISGKTYTPVQAGENPAPEWVDARMWSEVQAVAGLSAFNGLAESFAGPLLQDFKVMLFKCCYYCTIRVFGVSKTGKIHPILKRQYAYNPLFSSFLVRNWPHFTLLFPTRHK